MVGSLLDKDRVAGSLYGWLVGDALAMPGHWFYSPSKLRVDYGEITEMMAPKQTHAESMLQGMSYDGTIDILHDKAIYYEGATAAAAAKKLSPEQIQARQDDHGNFVGATEDERVHYHQSLKKGQNTINLCVGRVLMRCLAKSNTNHQDFYNPDEFLQAFQTYMTTKPSNNIDDDYSQVFFHNDTYLDVYVRYFFTQASKGTVLKHCAMSQREQWSIGSLDGVVMSIPIIAAYANEPESMVLGRAIEHHMLTHKSITVTMVLSILTPLLLDLYHGANLKESLEKAMAKLRPPKCTGREMRHSYVANKGPGRIPKHDKWLQHMVTADEAFFPDFVQGMLALENDEDVAGWDDRSNSRLSTACYCEQTFSVVLFLCYKYHDNPKTALLQNVMLGGHSTSRGAVVGAIMGAAYPNEIPFVQDLCAYSSIQQEIKDLVDII
jgi:ADP-ribosylglycohydrolase